MHDGFTGRILSRSMVSIVQILPSRLGGSRWANPVGQSTFDGANGFHRRVRHCHFRECPLKKHLNNCGARLRGAQSAAEPQPRNAKAASASDIKAPSPFQLLEPKARKLKTLNPNHQGNTQSSSAFSHRHSEGWQPRFQWGHIQQLPLRQAPGAYRLAPTQEPSRE